MKMIDTPDQNGKLSINHFSWLTPVTEHDPSAHFAALVMDLSSGLYSCLKIIHASDLEKAGCGSPLMSDFDKSNLMRLAVIASQILQENSEEEIDRLGEKHTPGTK